MMETDSQNLKKQLAIRYFVITLTLLLEIACGGGSVAVITFLTTVQKVQGYIEQQRVNKSRHLAQYSTK